MNNLMKMMHIVDASMRVEYGEIKIDEPYAHRMSLPIFSGKLDYVDSILNPSDSGVSFAAVVFIAETASWYPLFKVNNGTMERISDYVDSNYTAEGEGFIDRQMTKEEFDEVDGDFTVHLINLDDGTVPLFLSRDQYGDWTLNNSDFNLDIDDAAGLNRMVKKILQSSPTDFYD
ncbi:hypothetical protein J6W91_03475 [Candidatus Saccharibacteria bacterium]|nr:hypothetical protein [Candidatus Saccharibacteria bacterium]